MRIFLFKTGGLGDTYGIGSYINNIVEASKTHEKQVHFVIVDIVVTSKLEKIKITRKNNITYCRIPAATNGLNIYKDSLFPISISSTLFELFQLKKSDIFHFNSGMQFSLAKKLKNELNPVIIYTVHILLWKSIYHSETAFLKEFRNKALYEKLHSIHFEKDICKIANKVICMNSETVIYVKSTYNIDQKKILVLPNGLFESSDKTIISSISDIKAKLGLTNYKVILFVGRINPEKGIFDLIEVFTKHIADFKNVKLVVVGDGAISEALLLCNGIWNNVLFTGYVNRRDQLLEFYKMADLMVLPSYHEQSSFTLLEAIQNKKPLIVSDIPAFELLDNNACRKVGFVKRKGTDKTVINKKTLYHEICGLLFDEAKGRKLAENAFKTFQNKFNLKNIYGSMIRDAYTLSNQKR